MLFVIQFYIALNNFMLFIIQFYIALNNFILFTIQFSVCWNSLREFLDNLIEKIKGMEDLPLEELDTNTDVIRVRGRLKLTVIDICVFYNSSKLMWIMIFWLFRKNTLFHNLGLHKLWSIMFVDGFYKFKI